MDTLMPLASALGLGMLAGARLYATVFVVGLLLRLDWIAVPTAWQHASVLADTRVLVASGIACALEFIADKIPWVDSAWDSIHTFLRPIGAALLTSSLFSNLEPAYQVLLFLLAGGVAFSGHSAKAATRFVVNHSPEPFSNVAVSLAEDAFVAGGLYMLVKHPWIMAGIVLLFLALFAWLAPQVFRALRAEWAALTAVIRNWTGDSVQPSLAPAEREWLAANHPGRQPGEVFCVIATSDLKGLRNAIGTLCLIGGDAAFFARRWMRPVRKTIGTVTGTETRQGILVDRLILALADGSRIRFDLLAGQMPKAAQFVQPAA